MPRGKALMSKADRAEMNAGAERSIALRKAARERLAATGAGALTGRFEVGGPTLPFEMVLLDPQKGTYQLRSTCSRCKKKYPPDFFRRICSDVWVDSLACPKCRKKSQDNGEIPF